MNLTNPMLLFGLHNSFSLFGSLSEFVVFFRFRVKLVRIEHGCGAKKGDGMEWNGIEYKNAMFTRVNKLSAF